MNRESLCAFLDPKADSDGFLTCDRCEQHGAPLNMSDSCSSPEGLERRAAALVAYGESLPDGVTTEAFAEAANLRRQAARLLLRDPRPDAHSSTSCPRIGAKS